MNLDGAVGVVTGAARGIGLSLARRMLDAKARVVLTDVDGPALHAAVAPYPSDRARAIVADVTSARALAALTASVEAEFGPVTVWINNAGLARHRPLVEQPEPDIDRMISVNLKGAILGSQCALRVMAPRRRGHIVNIVSTAALRGIPTESVYCATKWGVRGFTQGLREEAAPSNVHVTAVLPGGVGTEFWRDAAPHRELPLHHFLTPDTVARAVVMLLEMPDAVVPQELVLRAMHDVDFQS